MPFIVLEGLDGAGKSTQLDKLTAMLKQRGESYEFVHFPRYESAVYGELIARFLRGDFGALDSVDPYLVSLLYAGDRADAAPMIREWVDSGKFVIVDRYVYSNIAFQCAKIDDQEEKERLERWILELEFGYNKLPRPDISIFLDVPFAFTQDSLSRRREGGDRDYLGGAQDIHEESMELQRKVREMYLSFGRKYEDIYVLECANKDGGMDSPESIFTKLEKLIKPFIE